MDEWEKKIACAIRCDSCEKPLDIKEPRILSVYTHEIICMECKAREEQKPDYADTSKAMISQCLEDTGRPYGNVGGFCFHHFAPYKC